MQATEFVEQNEKNNKGEQEIAVLEAHLHAVGGHIQSFPEWV